MHGWANYTLFGPLLISLVRSRPIQGSAPHGPTQFLPRSAHGAHCRSRAWLTGGAALSSPASLLRAPLTGLRRYRLVASTPLRIPNLPAGYGLRNPRSSSYKARTATPPPHPIRDGSTVAERHHDRMCGREWPPPTNRGLDAVMTPWWFPGTSQGFGSPLGAQSNWKHGHGAYLARRHIPWRICTALLSTPPAGESLHP